MKAIKIEGEDGEYKAIPVKISYDKDGELEYDEDAWLFNDDVEKLYVVEYNGKMYLPFASWKEIEEEFEDVVVDALKKDGCFQEVEYSDDPDDDDEATDIRLFILDI